MPLQDITPLPTPPSRSDGDTLFVSRADALMAALPGLVTEINSLATQLEATAALINAAPAYADPMLKALADGNTPAADKLPYLTGATSSAVTDFTSVARTLVAQTTQALMRTTGLGMSANGSSLVSAADYDAMRTLLSTLSNTYTPTLTNTTNISSSTAYACQYMRVGNTVTVSGRVDITATATGNTVLGISLPIASTLSTLGLLSGSATYATNTVANNSFAKCVGDTSNNRVTFQGNSTVNTSATWNFQFTYLVV